MRRTPRILSASAVMVAALLGMASTPAWAATISTGHIDALDVDYVGGALTLNIKTYSPAADDVAPAATTLVVAPAALVNPGPTFGCLGKNGTSVYLLPQTQNAALLWPGWNTQGVPAGQLSGDKVQLQLVSWTAPVGGKFALYTTSLGSATFRFNTNTAPGCQITTWPGGISRNVHGHGFWAFSHAGTYTLTFKATATTTGGVAKSSGNQTYTFVVG